jgi:hypothetical protein
MRQQFQIIVGLNRPADNPLERAREIFGDFRSGQVVTASGSHLTLTLTFERSCTPDHSVTKEDVKWCTEVLLLNRPGVRLIGVRELERKYTTIEQVSGILAPVEAAILLRRALDSKA